MRSALASLLLSSSATSLVSAAAIAVQAPVPVVTPAPVPGLEPTRTVVLRGQLAKRGLVDQLTALTAIPASVTKALGSAIPSDAANGILPGLTIPTEDQIKKQFNLNDTEISSLPIQVMNIPGYSNWTENGWNVRLHGTVYRNPNVTNEQLDDAAGVFVPDLDTSAFNETNRAMARNFTKALITLPVKDVNLSFALNYNAQLAANATFPLPTDSRGEFDQFVPVNFTGGVPDGNSTNVVQGLEVFTNQYSSGNGSTYLVPPTGITIISDIDDILRVTKIYQPLEGLNNSFAQPFVPWMNMPDVYKGWAQRLSGVHFHYLTTLPIKATQFYESFIYAKYPLGSFDIRPLNLTTVDQIFKIRKVDLDRVFQTFPQRKFVLVADTSNGDIMRDYPAMVSAYPGQVQCILLRNTTATDPSDHFPYNTEGFKNVSNSTYMFFRTPDDIMNLDFSKGDCRNASVPQNVTFGYQGLPSILNNGGSSRRMDNNVGGLLVGLVGALIGGLLVL